MIRERYWPVVALLLGLSLLVGCPQQAETTEKEPVAAAADDPHAGHDHAVHAEPPAAADPHAGHDHAATDESESAGEGDGAGESDAGAISLSPEQIRELGIASAPVGSGTLGRQLELTGGEHLLDPPDQLHLGATGHANLHLAADADLLLETRPDLLIGDRPHQQSIHAGDVTDRVTLPKVTAGEPVGVRRNPLAVDRRGDCQRPAPLRDLRNLLVE